MNTLGHSLSDAFRVQLRPKRTQTALARMWHHHDEGTYRNNMEPDAFSTHFPPARRLWTNRKPCGSGGLRAPLFNEAETAAAAPGRSPSVTSPTTTGFQPDHRLTVRCPFPGQRPMGGSPSEALS